MYKGYVSIVLHTHLPFIRHPDIEDPLEERWLFEAMHESYLPLIEVLDRLLADNIDFQLTMSITPTVMAMLEDEYLNERFEAHHNSLIELSEKELERTRENRDIHKLAVFYNERFKRLLSIYRSYDRNLMNAIRKFDKTGCLEVMASAATHALLPLFSASPEVIKAQLRQGIKSYVSSLGHSPKGFWLPECAYDNNIDLYLKELGIKYFICENKAVLHASPRPRYGTFAPIATKAGVCAFPRDTESSRQVWSNKTGYPGDYSYREFYRDIGHDLPLDYIEPYINKAGIRVDTGIKYHRITGKLNDKHIYDREAALSTAFTHGAHFSAAKRSQLENLAPKMDKPPIIVCPYDTELFGHWWFEGPEFLEAFIREFTAPNNTNELITPSEYLERHPQIQCSDPCPSSWGSGGDFSVWLNPSNDWIYRDLYLCEQAMVETINKSREFTSLQKRALSQAAKELMLAQASDWPFILSHNTAAGYAVNRVVKHIKNFNSLYEGIINNNLDINWLNDLEGINNIFPDINPEIFKD